ncbi:MAG: NAD(P)/FAD-dependent oxidoreductase [bacterium]
MLQPGAKVQRAIIVGEGVAGPVAALALQKAGISATIYEGYATTADGLGGTLMIAPNGLSALGIVGVDLDGVGQPIQRMIMADHTGKQLAEFPGLPNLPPSQVMWRSQLYRALHERIAAAGIAVEYNKRIVRVHETPTGVTAHFEDGTSATGDILIGADGIRSRVRTLIDPAAPSPKYVGFLGFGGLATGSAVRGKLDAMNFVFGRRAFLGYWTQADGSTIWFSSLPHPEPLTLTQARAIPATDWLQQLRTLYAGDCPGQDLLEHTTADRLLTVGAGEILPRVPRWHRGRMVLVGDAALAPSSSSGQGASLAIESAIELARCLRDVPDVSNAFVAYERMRRPRVEKVAAQAAKQNSNKAAGPMMKAVLSVLMPIAMKTFMRPEKMFGWVHNYRIDWKETVTT